MAPLVVATRSSDECGKRTGNVKRHLKCEGLLDSTLADCYLLHILGHPQLEVLLIGLSSSPRQPGLPHRPEGSLLLVMRMTPRPTTQAVETDGRWVKMEAHRAMHAWLAELRESGLTVVTPRHGLTDAYRSVLADAGELRTDDGPGPLAVSHVLWRSRAGHRMDRIFRSGGLAALAAGYDYAGGVAAGSDHALVWADLTQADQVRL